MDVHFSRPGHVPGFSARRKAFAPHSSVSLCAAPFFLFFVEIFFIQALSVVQLYWFIYYLCILFDRDIGGMLLTVMAFWSSLVMHHDRDRTVLVCYTIAIPITLYIRHSVSDSLVQGQGLPILEQGLSWILLGKCQSNRMKYRLTFNEYLF